MYRPPYIIQPYFVGLETTNSSVLTAIIAHSLLWPSTISSHSTAGLSTLEPGDQHHSHLLLQQTWPGLSLPRIKAACHRTIRKCVLRPPSTGMLWQLEILLLSLRSIQHQQASHQWPSRWHLLPQRILSQEISMVCRFGLIESNF